MEKIDDINVNRLVHKIYCDQCGKHLQDSVEYDDGWYHNDHEYQREFYLNTWYSIDKVLCDDCRKHMDKKIIDMLIDLGFSKQ